MCMSAKNETSKNIEKSERKYTNEWMVDRLQYTHAMIGNISLYKKRTFTYWTWHVSNREIFETSTYDKNSEEKQKTGVTEYMVSYMI